MVFYTLVVTILLKILVKNENKDDTLMRKKAKEKQNSDTMRISLDVIRIVFPAKLKITRGIV